MRSSAESLPYDFAGKNRAASFLSPGCTSGRHRNLFNKGLLFSSTASAVRSPGKNVLGTAGGTAATQQRPGFQHRLQAVAGDAARTLPPGRPLRRGEKIGSLRTARPRAI